MPTRSPGSTPRSINPRAISDTISPTSAKERSRHSPPTLCFCATRSPNIFAARGSRSAIVIDPVATDDPAASIQPSSLRFGCSGPRIVADVQRTSPNRSSCSAGPIGKPGRGRAHRYDHVVTQHVADSACSARSRPTTPRRSRPEGTRSPATLVSGYHLAFAIGAASVLVGIATALAVLGTRDVPSAADPAPDSKRWTDHAPASRPSIVKVES